MRAINHELKVRVLLLGLFFISSCDNLTTTYDISGRWIGYAEGLSDVPENPDMKIFLVFQQVGTTLSGTFSTGERVDTLSSGEVIEDRVLFTITKSRDRIRYIFSATIDGSRMAGRYTIVDDSTEIVYGQNEWYAQPGPNKSLQRAQAAFVTRLAKELRRSATRAPNASAAELYR